MKISEVTGRPVPKNEPTVPISKAHIAFNEKQIALIVKAVEIGIYGTSVTDFVRRAVDRELERLLDRGCI